jgi:hypothetical protein
MYYSKTVTAVTRVFEKTKYPNPKLSKLKLRIPNLVTKKLAKYFVCLVWQRKTYNLNITNLNPSPLETQDPNGIRKTCDGK